MSDDKNLLPDTDLDWAIVLGLGAQPLLGVLHQWGDGLDSGNKPPLGIARRWLEPAYAFGVNANPVMAFDPVTKQPVPTGQVQIQHSAQPVLFMPSIKRVDLPESVSIVRVRDLSPADRRTVMLAAKQGEAAAMEIRFGQSGLQAVPPGAQLRKPQLVK